MEVVEGNDTKEDTTLESDTPSPVQIVPGQIYITTEGIMLWRFMRSLGTNLIMMVQP